MTIVGRCGPAIRPHQRSVGGQRTRAEPLLCASVSLCLPPIPVRRGGGDVRAITMRVCSYGSFEHRLPAGAAGMSLRCSAGRWLLRRVGEAQRHRGTEKRGLGWVGRGRVRIRVRVPCRVRVPRLRCPRRQTTSRGGGRRPSSDSSRRRYAGGDHVDLKSLIAFSNSSPSCLKLFCSSSFARRSRPEPWK